MSLSQSLLPEFDHEMANTRKVLERIPEDKLDWKVHDKSNTIGWVGMHLAEIPGWVDVTLNHDSLDVAPVGGEPYRTPKANSRQEILDRFDKNFVAGRGPRGRVRRTIHETVVALEAGRNDVHDASRGRAAQFCPQPQYPPSGPLVRLPATERRPGARVVRSFGGRAGHVAARG